MSGWESAIPGSAAALSGASDNSAGFRSRWTSVLASLGFAPQTPGADRAPQQAPFPVPQQNCKASPEFRAAGRPGEPEKHGFAGTRPQAAPSLTTQPNKGLGRADRVDVAATQKKKENAGKTTPGDTDTPRTGFAPSVAVTAPSSRSAQAPPSVDATILFAHPANANSISANRVEAPIERAGNAESSLPSRPPNTERLQPNAAAEVRPIANPHLPAGVDADKRIHTAEPGPVSPATPPGDPDAISAFHHPQSDTNPLAEPHSATAGIAAGTRPSTQPALENASFKLGQGHDPLETSSALHHRAMDSAVQPAAPSNSPQSGPALNASHAPAAKAARQNPADDSIRSERQPSPPAWPAATPLAVSDSGNSRASVEKPDAPERMAPGDTFMALDRARSSPPATWIHAGAHHAEAGYLDPALGWVGVRADAVANGVHAALVPGSAEAAQVLGTHLSGLNAYLSEQHGPPATVIMGTLDAGPGGLGSGINPGNQSDGGSGEHQAPPAAGDDSAAPSTAMRSAPAAHAVPPLASVPAVAGRYISVMA